MPAILIEVCFVDSQADADLYHERFDRVCYSIASAIAGEETDVKPPAPPEPDVEVLTVRGKVSHFGGPADAGVSPSEGLAFIYNEDDTAPWLFLPNQPPNTTGLARRLIRTCPTSLCGGTMRFTLKTSSPAWITLRLSPRPRPGARLLPGRPIGVRTSTPAGSPTYRPA